MTSFAPLFSAASNYWRTDPAFVAWLRARFDFTLDAAATDALIAPSFISPEQDALLTAWGGRVYVNPPYTYVEDFIDRALTESRHCEGVCLLVPARTDTAWWQESFSHWNRIELIRGRLRFWMTDQELAIVNAARAEQGKPPISQENLAPFPSALLIKGFGYAGHAVGCVDWKQAAKGKAA